MEQLAVNLFRITVLVNPDLLNTNQLTNSPGITLLSNDISLTQTANGKNLLIPQGLAVIGLYVVTLPASNGSTLQAQLAPNPVTWMVESDEQLFQVIGPVGAHATIVDFNVAANQGTHQFMINVSYGNAIYTQDPTIVNQPPMPMGDG